MMMTMRPPPGQWFNSQRPANKSLELNSQHAANHAYVVNRELNSHDSCSIHSLDSQGTSNHGLNSQGTSDHGLNSQGTANHGLNSQPASKSIVDLRMPRKLFHLPNANTIVVLFNHLFFKCSKRVCLPTQTPIGRENWQSTSTSGNSVWFADMQVVRRLGYLSLYSSKYPYCKCPY